MATLEAARERHQPSYQRSQTQPDLAALPHPSPSPERRQTMRRSEPWLRNISHANDHPDYSNTEGDLGSGRQSNLQGAEALLLEAHYITDINLG
jgi:hypothetical protein